jgi:hypothetical protein
MHSSPCIARIFSAVLAGTIANAAWSEDKDKPLPPAEFSFEVGMGGEYDSNVSVEEVDRASNEGDYALTLDASLEAKKQFTGTLEAAASYDFSQNLYRDFSEVDRQTHILGTDLSLDGDSVDTGLSFFYINSRLDNEKFLELYRVSPSVSGFLSRKWFGRAAYVFTNKSIENRPERDADTHSGEFDIYYFRRGLRSYFNLGYRYKDEEAEADRLDYESHSAKLRYIHRFDIFSRIAKMELSWRYEDRNYSSITPSIGEDRDDERHRWRADFEMPVVGRTSVQLYYSYSDYESNYPQADYTQYLIGTRFFFSW